MQQLSTSEVPAMDHLAESNPVVAARLSGRIERLRCALNRLRQEGVSTDIRVESPGGDVAVSVDRGGRLVALWLAPGSTHRFTHQALECLINDALRAAVEFAAGGETQWITEPNTFVDVESA